MGPSPKIAGQIRVVFGFWWGYTLGPRKCLTTCPDLAPPSVMGCGRQCPIHGRVRCAPPPRSGSGCDVRPLQNISRPFQFTPDHCKSWSDQSRSSSTTYNYRSRSASDRCRPMTIASPDHYRPSQCRCRSGERLVTDNEFFPIHLSRAVPVLITPPHSNRIDEVSRLPDLCPAAAAAGGGRGGTCGISTCVAQIRRLSNTRASALGPCTWPLQYGCRRRVTEPHRYAEPARR